MNTVKILLIFYDVALLQHCRACMNGHFGRSLLVGRSVGRQYSYFWHWSQW